MTFFDWPQIGPNIPGSGEIASLALRVPSRSSLDWWAERLTEHSLTLSELSDDNGRTAIEFTDPEGQCLRLVDDGGVPSGTPWAAGPVPADHALRGLDSATLTVRRLEPTVAVLTDILGMRLHRE